MSNLRIAQLFDLTDQAALVTGGAKGIGQGIALRLAEAGATVMMADVDLDAAEQTALMIRRQDGKAAVVRADTSQVADAQAAVDATVQTFGRLDILVNNAGVFPFTSALEMTEAQWERVLDINLKGAFFFAQAAARRMIAGKRGGVIINIASIDAFHPTGFLAHYDASKGGMRMLTKSLAVELAPQGIRVNAIAPGGITTPGAAAGTAAALQAAHVNSEQLTEQFLARIPLKRMGEPDDIATVALFLASQASAYMTGDCLIVDGGYLLS
jgi:2-deoxy-D-gluconate 3-dehydrogenase